MDSNYQIVKLECRHCGSRLSLCAQAHICIIIFFTNNEYLLLFFNLREVFPLCRTVCQPCLFVCTLYVNVDVCLCPGCQSTRWNPLLSSDISISM